MGEKDKSAGLWLDRNRRTFVTTAGNMPEPFLQTRTRWRQVGDEACPVEINVAMPRPVFEYFEVAGVIDQHNRVRQDSLNLEKSIEVKEWSFRLNSTLLGMVRTDAWHLYKFGRRGRRMMSPHTFSCQLATALIDNSCDATGVRRFLVNTKEVLGVYAE